MIDFNKELKRSKLKKEIEQSINKYSLENYSDTPDFILAQYLVDCLKTFEKSVIAREVWHGRKKEE